MAELFGKTTGICRGQGGSMHMFSKEWNVLGGFAFIGEGIPARSSPHTAHLSSKLTPPRSQVATGAAFRTKYLREVMKDDKYDQVSVAFFGDGTANNGAFYECLNMASLYKLPIIFVVENNLWAIGMNHWRATAPSSGDDKPHIYKKGEPFGMPGVLVDGMDVLKVRDVAAAAVARARAGDGPTLIEAETYRFRGHSLADPDELRSKEEKEHFAAMDPIPALEKQLLAAKLASSEELAAVRKEVDAVVEESVTFAEASPSPQRAQLLENVFPDPKGFGIAMDGKYHFEDPSFSEGTANV
jgi:pyruvate dehydrogenase E1 component alpha subunit